MPTFYDRFRECADLWPQNIALEIQRGDQLESFTYGQVRSLAESVGRWIVENGFQPGTRAAILADNHPRWVIAYLGIMAAGCTAVPLDTALHADQIGTLLKDSGASLLFSDQKHLAAAKQASNGLAISMVLSNGEGNGSLATLDQIFSAGPGSFRPVPARSDYLASLLYTSGTTADPKGVMLTHANLMGEADGVFHYAQLGSDDALLGVLPLFHVLSQMANLFLPLVKGMRVVYLETLNTTELLRALNERGITVFAVVPQFFYLIHERIFKDIEKRGKLTVTMVRALMRVTHFCRNLGWNPGKIFFRKIHGIFGHKMRYLVTGGSRFDPQIAWDFHDMGIDVLQAYGLTETTGGAFATPPSNNRIGSVGPPFKGVEGKIADPQPQEDGGIPVGEIAIRGAIVMKGYWNRPDATAAALRNGWFHTGDLGYFDADGNLFITGRQKEVIVLGNGKNIYPEEVEAHYLKSAYIKEICVMAQEARPGDPTSERLYAVVVPNFEVLKQRKIVNAREVIRYDIEGLSVQLATTKRISGYEIWQEDLPRTTTRKLKRFEIEKRVRGHEKSTDQESELSLDRPLTGEEMAWLDRPEVERGLKIVREASRSESPIRPGDNLELDLGFDSMQRVELLASLEQGLGGNVEESRLAEIYTVKELLDAVLESAAAGAKVATRQPVKGWDQLLREESTDPEILALIQPRQVSANFLFFVMQLVQMVALDRFHLRMKGLEKVPTAGPMILCSNHQSYIDPFVMSSVLPWPIFSRLCSVGTSDIFGGGIMRKVARLLRVVVVDPDANLMPAMRAGSFALRHGRALILYPEGERSIDGPPKIFKKGAAILSIHLQVPIVPVAIEGFYDAWPRGKRFQKFAPLQMTFGDPMFPPPEGEASEAVYEKVTADLKERVVAMWQELRAERR